MAEIRKHRLELGDGGTVKSPTLGIGTTWQIVYAGMPSHEVFSLGVTRQRGYWSTSYNLYCPVSQRTLKAAGGEVEILEVNPKAVVFNFIG